MPVVRDCPVCGQPATLHPSEVEGFSACSPACAARARRKFPDLGDLNPLQRRCLRYMERERLSFAAFARRVGVHPSGLRWWFKRPGSTTSRETITGLAAVFGLTEAQALKEAGGHTAHDVHVRVGLEQEAGAFAVNRRLGYTPEVIKKRAAAQTGLTRSAQTREKIRAANRAPELVERARERALALQQTQVQQVLTRLGARLAHEPAPGAERQAEWEALIAAELGMRRDVVRTICRPNYRKRGLVGADKGGPRPLETRHRIVEAFMAERGVTPWSQKPRGFWDQAADRVEERDPAPGPEDVISGPSLRTWYVKHLQRCSRTYFRPKVAQRGLA